MEEIMSAHSDCVVETKHGKVRGKYEKGLYTFLGIPYGRYGRFHAAQEPEPWEGEWDGTVYGPCQPQGPIELKWENCDEEEFTEKKGLHLNVWTPACDGKKRPVIVWIHGGGNLEGSPSNPTWDGAHLIGGHDAVEVSISYRLGFFGCLYLGHLLGDKYATSGSNNDLDKILALEWIRANIERFGGDPDCVTIMGQSGGAKSVGNLIVSPLAKGLFSQAIMMSGCAHCLKDLGTAEEITANFLEICGLKADEAEKLLTMTVDEMLEKQNAYRSRYANCFASTIDGVVYTMHPADYIASGACGDISVLIGYCGQEFSGHWSVKGKDPEVRRDIFRTRFSKKNASHIIKLYDEFLKDNDECMAYQEIANRYFYANGSVNYTWMLASAGIKTWCYRWDFMADTGPIHLSDLSYVFRYTFEEDPEYGHGARYDYMSKVMNETWMSYVMNGNPNNDQIPEWRPYTSATNGQRMYFGAIPAAADFDLNRYDHDFEFIEFSL